MPWLIREETGADVSAFQLESRNDFDTDIPRLRHGLVGAQFWSQWIRGETDPADTRSVSLKQIDIVLRIINDDPETFELALTADDIERVFGQGKIASLPDMEGGYVSTASTGSRFGNHLMIVANRLSGSTGLATKSFIPASRQA